MFLYQYGFRKSNSTTFALVEITDKIKKILDEDNYVIGIFLDLTKAFDTVNHEILLYKLYKYGIRGHANNFFVSYLTERKQYICINGVNSSTKQINCGVQQGSVLGPFFFILYINDIINAADANNIRLYADDTWIFLHNRNINNLVGHTRTYLRKLFKWFTCNKLTVNGTKSYFTVFHTKNKDVPEELQGIEIDDIEIQRSYSVKYIGLLIDEKLNWDVHIDSLIKSLVKYFGIFNHIKDYVSTHLARQMYYAFVYSRINYGVEVYSSCSNKLMDKAQVDQNKLLKLLLRCHPRSSTNELHNNLGILKVYHISEISVIIFAVKCLQGDCPPCLKLFQNPTQPVWNKT